MLGCELRVNQPKESVLSPGFVWGEPGKGKVPVLLLGEEQLRRDSEKAHFGNH